MWASYLTQPLGRLVNEGYLQQMKSSSDLLMGLDKSVSQASSQTLLSMILMIVGAAASMNRRRHEQ